MSRRQAPNSIAEVNRLNEGYWSERARLVDKLIGNAGVVKAAMYDLLHAESRKPFGSQRRFDVLLEEADAELRGSFQTEFALRGVRARKQDLLHEWMEATVVATPLITSREMMDRIRASKGVPPIQDVTDEEIFIFGREKPVPVSGVKDRLSRIKKELRIRATGQRES